MQVGAASIAVAPGVRLRMYATPHTMQAGAFLITAAPGLRLRKHRHAAYHHAGRASLIAVAPGVRLRVYATPHTMQAGAFLITAAPGLRLRKHRHAAYHHAGRASSIAVAPGLRLRLHRLVAYHAGRGVLLHLPRQAAACAHTAPLHTVLAGSVLIAVPNLSRRLHAVRHTVPRTPLMPPGTSSDR